MNRTGICSIARKFLVGAMFLVLGWNAGAQAQQDDGGPLADAPVIFDVRRSLPMEPDEPTFHDFYISAGVEAGIKKGQFLPVARQMPVHDPIANKQQAIITIPVGKLQVIHVERNIAVARLVNELRDDERPTLEFEAVMIGDRVDLKRATMDAPKENEGRRRSTKRKSAALVAPIAAEAAVPATASSGAFSGASSGAASALPVNNSSSGPAPSVVPGVAPTGGPSVAPGSAPVNPPRSTQSVPPPQAV
ncbi:MAG TPA: hypothetical protein PLZ57_04565 [Pseudobdellovibrionaceae bacterium]|nr:hypothetical protein [Pseudobdellovibrionaceae bacterium]